MAIKVLKPTTPGQRQMTSQDFDGITAKKPVKSLIKIKKGSVGRNNQGRITTRHRGGGVKRFYRQISYSLATNSVAHVEAIEYDPNRSARIARVRTEDGTLHYVLAALNMRVGDKITASKEAAIETGNVLPLKEYSNWYNYLRYRTPAGQRCSISSKRLVVVLN